MQIDFEYFYHSEETKFFTYFYTFVHFIIETRYLAILHACKVRCKLSIVTHVPHSSSNIGVLFVPVDF